MNNFSEENDLADHINYLNKYFPKVDFGIAKRKKQVIFKPVTEEIQDLDPQINNYETSIL